MTQFTLDPSTASHLGNSTGRVELLDPKGNIIGYFNPIPKVDLSTIKGLSEAELKEALQQPTKTTAEVLQFWRASSDLASCLEPGRTRSTR